LFTAVPFTRAWTSAATSHVTVPATVGVATALVGVAAIAGWLARVTAVPVHAAVTRNTSQVRDQDGTADAKSLSVADVMVALEGMLETSNCTRARRSRAPSDRTNMLAAVPKLLPAESSLL